VWNWKRNLRIHLQDGVDCCKGYIGHFKNQNGLQMADLIQPPANRCFYRQYRTINGYRLCRTLVCIFPVILHKFRLTGASLSALNLYNLTKNLTAQSHDNNYVVLPIF